MIDTDKYEGHTPAPWNTDCAEPDAGLIANIDAHDRTVARMVNGCLADTQLLADAPLLLEEVKRLQGVIHTILTEYNKDTDKIIREVDEEDRTFEQNALIHIMKICFRVWTPSRFRGDGDDEE